MGRRASRPSLSRRKAAAARDVVRFMKMVLKWHGLRHDIDAVARALNIDDAERLEEERLDLEAERAALQAECEREVLERMWGLK